MFGKYFSLQQFEQLGLDTELARKLADELALMIHQEMRSVAEKRLEKCINRLNSMNHNLELYENESDYVSYCDISNRYDTYRLRVSLDLVAATGYAHLVSNDEDEIYLEM